MANILRIKRRASGNPGAPLSLQNAELAFNEVDDILYYGKGAGGENGTATLVEAIAGSGAFVNLTGAQTIDGAKTFSQTIIGNIDTASKLLNSRTISVGGDITGNASFDGSSNITITSTLVNSGVTAGSYGSSTSIPVITIDAKGRITNASTADIATELDFSGDSGSGSLSLLTDTLAVTGGDGITTSANNTTNSITVDADNTIARRADTTYIGTTAVALNRASGDLNLTGINSITAGAGNNNVTLVPTGTGSVDVSNTRIVNVANPVGALDAVNKGYVDLAVQGLDPKQSVKAATTANLATLSGELTIDGVALLSGDRVLVKNQDTTADNGIYVVDTGVWTRSLDTNTWQELVSAYVFVEQGTTNADNGFLCTVNSGGTLGSDPVLFVQFNGAGQVLAGAGLSKTGNQLDVVAGTGITVAADSVALSGQALALHNLATNGIFVRTADGSVSARTLASSSTSLTITNGDGVAGNPTISVTDALQYLGQVTVAANKLVYFDTNSSAATATITGFALSLLDDIDAATARSTLGLGSMAIQNSTNVSITGGTIDGITFDMGTF